MARKDRARRIGTVGSMPTRIAFGLLLTVIGVAAWLSTAVTATAQDSECDVIMPAANRLETAFNLLSADPPPNAGTQIQFAASPLFGLTSPAAIDLRLWSSTVADQVNGTNPYHAADLGSDLRRARQKLAEAREYCAPS